MVQNFTLRTKIFAVRNLQLSLQSHSLANKKDLFKKGQVFFKREFGVFKSILY